MTSDATELSGGVSGLSMEKYSQAQLLHVAERTVAKKRSTSNIFAEELVGKFPSFSLSELEVGKVLGRGGFCVVRDVNKIRLAPKEGALNEENDNGDGKTDFTDDAEHDRITMANNCLREGKDCRYAIKMVQDSTKDPSVFVRSLVDLVSEARFLAVIRHPNIIKMRAVSDSSPFVKEAPYFVIVDKLYDTLATRLNTSWKKRMPGMLSRLNCASSAKAVDFWVERLSVAYDIANAVTYLHQTNIVYRDLTPNNIGFDIRDDVKIFDFGLSKEIQPQYRQNNGTYLLTADVGSLRYMAPEVALGRPYNQSCDVYSFSILLWQILKVMKPFEIYDTKASFQAKVVIRGARPKTHATWDPLLNTCMKEGWDANISKRPTMAAVLETLDKVISEESGEERSEVAEHSKHSAANNLTSNESVDSQP
eukprot:CAMPEP_0198153428 /NCGR_PEP_ID=MMETSP1443-20131203/64158_1 /TAXON_ID=186043 /ORGANISM="Entomoneis sp., Strain CCMP2396" /LENGTH=421 /DNA_ID=CAMNT_0043819769 /DNA_START=25 /DNA_END=1290 /DNA_ORIENTATION=+